MRIADGNCLYIAHTSKLVRGMRYKVASSVLLANSWEDSGVREWLVLATAVNEFGARYDRRERHLLEKAPSAAKRRKCVARLVSQLAPRKKPFAVIPRKFYR